MDHDLYSSYVDALQFSIWQVRRSFGWPNYFTSRFSEERRTFSGLTLELLVIAPRFEKLAKYIQHLKVRMNLA
jgi:hypothetical protein